MDLYDCNHFELIWAAENKQLCTFAFHPGSVRTDLFRASRLEEVGAPADDPPELAAAALLYITSGKADWLNGR